MYTASINRLEGRYRQQYSNSRVMSMARSSRQNGLTGHIRPEELYRDIANVPPKEAEYRHVSLYCILFHCA